MLKMVELDHRLVVVGGLIVSCLFYQVPLYTILVVIICGCVVYLRNRYKRGWRVSLGLSGLQLSRQTRSTRLRNASSISSISPRSSPSLASSKSAEKGSGLALPSTAPWGRSVTFKASPLLQLDYGNYNCRENVRSRFRPSSLADSTPCHAPPGISPKVLHPAKSEVQRTGSAESGMDVSLNKSDTTYNAICQEKYVGIGVYPMVNLDPLRPGLLSHFNSTMTRNRVTVKVAPPEKVASLKPRTDFPRIVLSPDSIAQDRDIVFEALRSARKRPIREDTVEKKTTKKRQKTEEELTDSPSFHIPPPYPSPPSYPVPNGIPPQFESSLSRDLMHILCPHFVTEAVEATDSFKKPSIVARAQTNAIFSSYSSSRKMTENVHRNRVMMKRKSETVAADMPEKKVSRNKCCPLEPEECPDASVDASDPRTIAQRGGTEEEVSLQPHRLAICKTTVLSEEKPYMLGSALAGNKSPLPIYIPSHIPTLKDYLEDQKTNRQRLKKLLDSFSSGEGKKGEENEKAKRKLENLAVISEVKENVATLVPLMQVAAHFVQPALPAADSAAVTNTSPPFSLDASSASNHITSNDPKSQLAPFAYNNEISEKSESTRLDNFQKQFADGTEKLSHSEHSTMPSVSLLPVPTVSFGNPCTTASVPLTSPTTVNSNPLTASCSADTRAISAPLHFSGGNFGFLSPVTSSLKTVASNPPTMSAASNLAVTSASVVSLPLPRVLTASPVPSSSFNSVNQDLSFAISSPTESSMGTVSFPFSCSGLSSGASLNFPTTSLKGNTSVTPFTLGSGTVPSVSTGPTTILTSPFVTTQSVAVLPSSTPLYSFSSGTTGIGYPATTSSQSPLNVLSPPTSSGTSLPFGNLVASKPLIQTTNLSSMLQFGNYKSIDNNSTFVYSDKNNVNSQNSVKLSFGQSEIAAPHVSSNVTLPTFGSTFNSLNSAKAGNQKLNPGLLGTSNFVSPAPAFGSNAKSTPTFGSSSAFGVSNPGFSSGFGLGATTSAPVMSFSTLQSNTSGNGPVANNFPPTALFTFGSNATQPSTGGFNFGSISTSAANIFSGSVVEASANAPNTNFQLSGQSTNPSSNGLFQSPSSNGNDSSISVSSPFTFGSPSTSSSQGFSFNPMAKPSFNFMASSPAAALDSAQTGMFSIGSGSTTARHGKTSTSRLRSHR